MLTKLRWLLAVSFIIQWPAPGRAAEPAPTNPIAARVITVQQGESVRDALRRAMRAERIAARLGEANIPASPETGTTAGAPQIVAGNIVVSGLNVIAPPAAPTLQFRFTAPSGFSIAEFEFTSPHGQTLAAIYTPSSAPGTHGSVTFQDFNSTLGLYAEPGAWTLTFATISGAGTSTTYDQAQLASIFKTTTINVTNTGTPDFTPPDVTAGKIMTPVVHAFGRNPYFITNLTVSDDVSGVDVVYVFVEPLQGSGFATASEPPLPLPVLDGSAVNEVPFGFYSIQGPYKIVAYGATDVAGNLFEDESAADIKALFGRTGFFVEN